MLLFVYSGQAMQGNNEFAPAVFAFSFDFLNTGDTALHSFEHCLGVDY